MGQVRSGLGTKGQVKSPRGRLSNHRAGLVTMGQVKLPWGRSSRLLLAQTCADLSGGKKSQNGATGALECLDTDNEMKTKKKDLISSVC